MKASLALAGAILLGSSLAACGSDSGEGSDYCKDLKTASTTFKDIDSGDVSALDKAFKTFHNLADEAPSDIESDWKTLDDGITSVEKALKDAGIEISDFAEIQKGNLPEGVDAAKLQEAAGSFTKLSDAKFTKAADAIEKHGKDVCKVNLSS